MSGSIRFDGDYGSSHLERRLANALQRGQLPGAFGLVQEIVGHWTFPKDEYSYLRLGKALLDTVGSALAYRESSREVVEGEGSPTVRWLRRNGYSLEYAAESRGLGSFVRGALAGVEFQEQRVRSDMGDLDRAILKAFEIAPGKLAFLLDPWGGEPVSMTGPETQTWAGPFCRPQDVADLEAFLRERIWRERLKADTLLLDVGQPGKDGGDDAVSVSAVSGAFDFASANEAFNDVGAFAQRCAAFVFGGRSRRLLFHGPPGTGKSTLARAIARELGARTVLLGHEATTRLADATMVQILALLAPTMLVLNDVDRSGEHEALALLHGLEVMADQPMIAVLTANDVETLDPAILRPGRVDEIREIPEPSRESREVILAHYADRFGLDVSDEDTETFLERSEGFSPADIREFAETARAVGLEVALDELERIAAQRELYAGDRCEEFNQRSRGMLRHRRMWRRRA